MNRLRLRSWVLPVLLVSSLAACVGGARVSNDGVSTPAQTDAMAEREAIWRARVDSARLRFTPADVRFMQDMIGHHAQALGMANLAPANGSGPAVRTLAARIHNAQSDEIAIMQRWLRDRGQPVPEVHVQGHRVIIHGLGDHAAHAMMPGMLTDAQFAELAAARDARFDTLFLTFMIAHHKGAVVMVDSLFATDGAGQDADVFRFASDVQVDQRTEVARMELMLRTP